MSDKPLDDADIEVLKSAFRGTATWSPHSSRVQDLVRRGYVQLLPALTPKGLDALKGKGDAT